MTGPELRAALTELDITQLEFARRLNIHSTTVYDWTRGERYVPPWVPYVLDLLRQNRALRDGALIR